MPRPFNPDHPLARDDKQREYDRVRMRERMNLVRSYKAARGCERCGEADADCLHLHHPDPQAKDPFLRKAGRSIYNLGIKRIAAELEKCEILCANCHARETARQRRERYPDRWVEAS